MARSNLRTARLAKAFDLSLERLMRMQNSYDIAKARAKEGEIILKRYVPRPKDGAWPSLL